MLLFTKPIAEIYVSELRKFLDPEIVPIFTPDTTIEVGDFGSFDDGRFVRRGNVADKGLQLDVDQAAVNPFEFASSGKVSIGPSVKVPKPAGGELLKAIVSFTKARAVVSSFKAGVERSVRDSDGFSDQLMQLWYGKELRPDRSVVWSVRRAAGGTVLISQDAGNQVEVIVDAALLGPAGITLSDLSAGVTFGAERKVTWKMSSGGAPLVVWARILTLSDDHARVVDAFGYEAQVQVNEPTIRPIAFTTDDLLRQLR
jgi:hypothetical protein